MTNQSVPRFKYEEIDPETVRVRVGSKVVGEIKKQMYMSLAGPPNIITAWIFENKQYKYKKSAATAAYEASLRQS